MAMAFEKRCVEIWHLIKSKRVNRFLQGWEEGIDMWDERNSVCKGRKVWTAKLKKFNESEGREEVGEEASKVPCVGQG